jgi:hypothetical protein
MKILIKVVVCLGLMMAGTEALLGSNPYDGSTQPSASFFTSTGADPAQMGGGYGPGYDSGWQVRKAEWGAGNRRMDVTNRVQRLLSGNGPVKVNNQNMGGDPAVGADKTLWIHARNSRGQSRDFTYKEGSTIDASQFYGNGGHRPDYGGGYGNLQILRAFYGAGNRTNDVTGRLRSMIRGNSLVVQVNNKNMGGDPAVGADKTLTVTYRFNGREQTVMVKEGDQQRNQLRIP